jgi:predicted metalloprotease with PDZ domain
MKYVIRQSLAQEHFFDIELHCEINTEFTEIQLPAWRPGRYELQNFAKNIQEFNVFDNHGNILDFTKISKDRWKVHNNFNAIVLKYNYYANLQDAGNSFVDQNTFYLNFVNCLPYIINHTALKIDVFLEFPDHWGFACALPAKKLKKGIIYLQAENYNQLVDSPFLASSQIQNDTYTVKKTTFYIHFAGNYTPNWNKILNDFKAFTIAQINEMGDFPTKEYHFIIWILPTAYYHGVEHGSSTMIVLGPDIEGDNLLTDILGVCSHELFHAWNICKIRPNAMMPYDFSKENYFDTGFVVEGVTTYFGDLFLKQAQIFTKEEYLKELTATCIRHFSKNGQSKQSLVESSIDLWMDGYTVGIPNKKVSIYYKGAVVALILDLMIRLKHDHKKSLFTVMKYMWDNYGKTSIGYTLQNYKQAAEIIYEDNLDEYFSKCIFGNGPLNSLLKTYLSQVGLNILLINTTSLTIEEVKKPSQKQKYNLSKFLNEYINATI